MHLIVTIIVFGVCMTVMAIGYILKGKAVRKDCGLDPVTGERITDCACAQGRPQECSQDSFLKNLWNRIKNRRTAETSVPENDSKVIDLPRSSQMGPTKP